METAALANLLDPSTLAQSLKAAFLSSSIGHNLEHATAYEAIRAAIDTCVIARLRLSLTCRTKYTATKTEGLDLSMT